MKWSFTINEAKDLKSIATNSLSLCCWPYDSIDFKSSSSYEFISDIDLDFVYGGILLLPIQMQPKYTVSCSPATYFYFVYFVNSSNAEAPYHTSSNAGYGWVSEYWSWAIDEASASCAVSWRGNITFSEVRPNWQKESNFLLIPSPPSPPCFYYYYFFFLCSGYISDSSSTGILVPGWLA